MNSYTSTVTYAGTGEQGGNNIGISAQTGGNIRMINNISVVDTDWGGFALSAGGVTGTLEAVNNIVYGINGKLSSDPDIVAVEVNTKVADPEFVDAPAGYMDENYPFDFRLNSGSPAIGYADKNYAPLNDYAGNLRDSVPDAGALEHIVQSGIEDDIYNDIKVYPTVFTNSIKIERQNSYPLKIELFTIDGQKVREEKMEPGELFRNINVNGLNRGMYLMKTGSRSFKLIKY
jgi:hypothetical protein